MPASTCSSLLPGRPSPDPAVIILNRIFLDKALESLRGARLEYDAGCFNNSANRSYYACFQAAIYALQMEGFQALRGTWGHEFVQAQVNGQLINRRHIYPADLRSTLLDNHRCDHREIIRINWSLRCKLPGLSVVPNSSSQL